MHTHMRSHICQILWIWQNGEREYLNAPYFSLIYKLLLQIAHFQIVFHQNHIVVLFGIYFSCFSTKCVTVLWSNSFDFFNALSFQALIINNKEFYLLHSYYYVCCSWSTFIFNLIFFSALFTWCIVHLSLASTNCWLLGAAAVRCLFVCPWGMLKCLASSSYIFFFCLQRNGTQRFGNKIQENDKRTRRMVYKLDEFFFLFTFNNNIIKTLFKLFCTNMEQHVLMNTYRIDWRWIYIYE